MNVLQPIATTQSLRVIPRSFPNQVRVEMTNEETDEMAFFLNFVSNSQGYMLLTIDLDMQEGESYELTVRDNADQTIIVYKGKVFVTSQTDTQNYNINNDLLTA